MRCRSSVLANLKPKSVVNFIGKALIEIAKYFTAALYVIIWSIAKFWSWYAGFFSSYLTQWHWCEYNQSNDKGALLEKLQFYVNENERNFFLNCPRILFASTPYVTSPWSHACCLTFPVQKILKAAKIALRMFLIFANNY